MFKIVHDESVKVYPHMYNGSVQQNPLCVESCVTMEFSMSPRFSPAFFYPDPNSVLLRAHLCKAVDSLRAENPVFEIVSRKREGLYNGNVQQNPSCAASCDANSVLLLQNSTSLYSGINTLYAQNPVFEIVHDESVKVYPHIMHIGMFSRTPNA